MSDLYDTDVMLWSERQAALLRRRAAGEPVNEMPDWSPCSIKVLRRRKDAMRCGRFLQQLSVALFLALVALSGPACAQQPAGQRIALVIGNGAYHNVDRLRNPGNDARLMASTLH